MVINGMADSINLINNKILMMLLLLKPDLNDSYKLDEDYV